MKFVASLLAAFLLLAGSPAAARSPPGQFGPTAQAPVPTVALVAAKAVTAAFKPKDAKPKDPKPKELKQPKEAKEPKPKGAKDAKPKDEKPPKDNGAGNGSANGNGATDGNPNDKGNGKPVPDKAAKAVGKPAAATAPSTPLDQDLALDAVARGEALPLARIVRLAQANWPGRVIDAQLVRVGGVLLYRLTLLSDDGVSRRVYCNAKSGAPVEAR